MPGVPCCTQTAVLRAVQATDGAILSLCLCVLSVWWDLQCKCQQVQLPKIIRDVSSPLYSVSVHVMYKCLGEGGTNAARCWVACTSHQADGWLRLLWPGCPSFQCTTTSIGTAYAATDTDLSGTAWAGDIDWEIPGESPWCIHMLACWHTHTSMKSGGWVALTNYPHPQHSGVSAWGKLDGLVGGGWISGRSGYWVERAPEVQTFSPQGLEEVEYLGPGGTHLF